ncbi:glycerate dehydrogenase [Ventosimonas gracilis]|uniref:Glycerate dehydrogenase n=1 Tax=Ventosimonas gracilis TaxID=1680762 RepID=A0A139SU23_9GAMM|nr:2-hydroxyacid dehydrogenase [Ventosimonas gracilis]KXU38014.1 glycerate dehydrogenase [Ventosimonas gracilis]
MPFHAVFLDQASLDLGDLELAPLRNLFDELVLHPSTCPEQVSERLQGAQIAISNKVPITRETLQACPELKLVLIAATGCNNIDLAAAGEFGVTVCNCQGYGTASVAQHCIGLLLALATRLADYQKAVQSGRWQQARQFCLLDFPIVELSGKTLGILGYGELGQAVGKLAQALGMQVLIGQLPGRPAQNGRLPLSQLLPQVDALSLHCPLTEQTRGLIGKDELRQMKKTAFLLNTARGGLVDEQALADALKNGHLGGAALDVLSEEPPRSGNVLLAPDIPRLLITPHNAWGSREARQRIVMQLAENTAAFLSGNPMRVIG